MDKRSFLQATGGATLGLMFGPAFLARYAAKAANEVAGDESFWAAVRNQFRLTGDYINLENGYYCFQPEPVLEAFIGNVRAVNFEGAHYMRTRQADDKRRARERLAEFAGCSAEELIITRNTTESLDTVISGFDWKPGDEAVLANQDYGAMIDMFKLQARRYGLRNRFVDIPMDPTSDEQVIRVYADALTPKTRLLMIPHMVNITGHILPVRAICDMAHTRGVPVMVDASHTFAHLEYKISDLNCDYYGASLHKWLATPLGAGVLYVKRDRIEKLWPIYGDETIPADEIRKFNHTGTHPVHTDLTIERALAFQEMIGTARKEARLRHLQQYWTSRARVVERLVLNTPKDPQRSCAIANVGVRGMPPKDLARVLLDKYKVFTVAIDGAGVRGVRVTPQVYTTTGELDAFVSALREIASSV
jgi:selenocysteine lyase/cysteine desulfurase